MRGWSENLQCKKPSFLTKWWDFLDLSWDKNILDLVYIYFRGVCGGKAFFLKKSFFEKHSTVYMV